MFRKKTVDGITAGLTRMVNDLAALKHAKLQEIDRINANVYELHERRERASLEAERASKVSARLEELVA